ncbi:hypothetical protein MCUN1_003828 [Malassezia cuniculi]|uniref:PHD-type domain-containing protein n=1 Tax=Malassezia cuniculi TaxID=948313 RepID=A0AAF0EU31_9BASI|nr:hypothetical protein MCUN1_003828 [Malassezia cuniculi]
MAMVQPSFTAMGPPPMVFTQSPAKRLRNAQKTPSPAARNDTGRRRQARPVRSTLRSRRQGSALGRTQYTLANNSGCASAAMKALQPVPRIPPPAAAAAAAAATHTSAGSSASASAAAAAGPTHPTPRVDPLAAFTLEAHTRTLAPVVVEGMGRIVMHCALLDQLGCPTQWHPTPLAPRYSTDERAARDQAVRRWLSADDDEPEQAAAVPVASPVHHPMVAKVLRERSRYSRMPRARKRDMWIAADGRRVSRRARMRTSRVTCTLRTLVASGITPTLGCRCGFRDEHMDLVQCDGCRMWLHLSCVGVCNVQQLGDGEWLCDDCYESTTALGRPASRPRLRGGLATTLAVAPPTPERPERRVSMCDAARTPSPPPIDLAFSTPSRTRARPAHIWTSPSISTGTPQTPCVTDTPLDLWATPQRALLGSRVVAAADSPWPESPVLATRAGGSIGDSWSSPPALSCHDSSVGMSSSPFPTTPTWSRENHSDAGYVMKMRIESAETPPQPPKHPGTSALLPPLAANGIV